MNIEGEIRKIVADVTRTNIPMTAETSLKNIGIDSLDMVQSIIAIEEKFGIEIHDETAQGFRTFGDVVSYVKNAVKK